nr:chitin elicitor receptor kinase 1 [Arachis hypogaea]
MYKAVCYGEPILPITLELLLPLSVIDLTPSPPSISRRRRRNELRSHRRYRAALFHHRAATVSVLKAPRSSVPSSPGSPPFSVEQLYSIVAGAISVPPVIPSTKMEAMCPSSNGGKGLSGGVIGGISVGIVAALLLLVFCVYVKCYRRRKMWNKKLVAKDSSENFVLQGETSHNAKNRTSASDDTSIIGVKVEKSAEFSYEELANATNNFSLAKKIGQGGFGEVYYGENGEEDGHESIKRIFGRTESVDACSSLKLGTLIGYCVEGSLFLVYEYIENGNLSQHLRNSDSEPLPWSTRVQIALDSARGLEYIHEHTMPVYIHRDVKSENILLDRNFRGEVADFGLTKLIDVGSSSAPTANMAGTFGYMPPEYVYRSVSPKIDVYAFGVVLYELISAKEALMRSGGASGAELKGLVALVIINDFAMELLQIEKQRKDEAHREALRVPNEERKKLKAVAAQIRAQEHKIAQQEVRETLLKERAEKLENWRMKVKKHGEKMAEKKELLRRQSSMWIDEANLEAQMMKLILRHKYWNPSFPFAESLIFPHLLWLGSVLCYLLHRSYIFVLCSIKVASSCK